jgi:hypothetical protein
LNSRGQTRKRINERSRTSREGRRGTRIEEEEGGKEISGQEKKERREEQKKMKEKRWDSIRI